MPASRLVTIVGFVVLFALAAAAAVVTRLRPDLVARFTDALRAAMSRHVLLRLAVLLAWAWLGWHFLVRGG